MKKNVNKYPKAVSYDVNDPINGTPLTFIFIFDKMEEELKFYRKYMNQKYMNQKWIIELIKKLPSAQLNKRKNK